MAKSTSLGSAHPETAGVKPYDDPQPKLAIDLVPRPLWGFNLKKIGPRTVWAKLKERTFHNASYRCEICGGIGQVHPVECHEVWHRDDAKSVQTLVGLVALCPACHEVKHMGRAQQIGRGDIALRHFLKVNNWSMAEYKPYADSVWEVWRVRSQHSWSLDLRILSDWGFPKYAAFWKPGELATVGGGVQRHGSSAPASEQGADFDTSCFNCGRPISDFVRPYLFCSEDCRKEAEMVRYARRVRRDGKAERADVQEFILSYRTSLGLPSEPQEDADATARYAQFDRRVAADAPELPCDDDFHWPNQWRAFVAARARQIKSADTTSTRRTLPTHA